MIENDIAFSGNQSLQRLMRLTSRPSDETPFTITAEFLTEATIQFFNRQADFYREATQDYDLEKVYQLFLSALNPVRRVETAVDSVILNDASCEQTVLQAAGSNLSILDFGCGPGRDVAYFKKAGFDVTGLDGSTAFCRLAKKLTGAEILQQNFLSLDLESERFDGIFAHASLFHIPMIRLPKILQQLKQSLKKGGVMVAANPEGEGEDWNGESYGNYMSCENFAVQLEKNGLKIQHAFRYQVGEPWRAQTYYAILARNEAE